MAMTEAKLEIYCLPTIVIWLTYYLMCVFWLARQPALLPARLELPTSS
jgi:hypothetical protein